LNNDSLPTIGAGLTSSTNPSTTPSAFVSLAVRNKDVNVALVAP
jgi:hypothetical protein